MGFRTRVVIPAYNAGPSVGNVVREVREAGFQDILVIDDGSTDETSAAAREAGAVVVRHEMNRGKGAALRTALDACARDGIEAMLTLDADGQHRGSDLQILMTAASDDAEALVLGIRDLVRAGAPRANQRSNAISNFFISRFAGQHLIDTNCGLRRYPVRGTIALGLRGNGFDLETEVLLRACRRNMRIVQIPINVHYPPERERKTHFRTRRDVPRIIFRVIQAVATARR